MTGEENCICVSGTVCGGAGLEVEAEVEGDEDARGKLEGGGGGIFARVDGFMGD